MRLRLFREHFSLSLPKRKGMFCFYLENRKRFGNQHVVHLKSCDLLPEKTGRTKLGFFNDFQEMHAQHDPAEASLMACTYCCKSFQLNTDQRITPTEN
ncbi:hypothetical protein [uncultured Christiangramia sp.]|uniref:hypothetical protein n=1 Tax=uncultured Christiangramia sp. TaxID=503836 RepID=UPI002615A0AA|nr:hypothetical protein [uncultured Christiangramia sp.]